MDWVRFIILACGTLLISGILVYLLAAEITHRAHTPGKTKLGNGRPAAGASKQY